MNAEGCGAFMVPTHMWKFLGKDTPLISDGTCWDFDAHYRSGYKDPKLEEKRRKAIDWLRKTRGWILDIPQRVTDRVPSA